MNLSDIEFHSAREQAAAIAAREVSSVELLEHLLSRVERLNPGLNAIVTLDDVRARRRAREADEALVRGESWGALHGVPMTVKDAFEVEGTRTTSGSTRYADHVADCDAVAVARLKAAGAIIFGKTNLPAETRDWQSYNDLFGRTNNPWDLGRTPGGSSGGSAAVLAAGLTALELGSDTVGSIRIPAHFCGVYGLKSTFGVIPFRGHIPGPPGSLAEYDLSVVGPLARDPDDLELALQLVAGPTDDRAPAWRLELPAPRRAGPERLRVAAWLDDPFCAIEQEHIDMLRTVVGRLREAGATVEERPGPLGLEENMSVYAPLLRTQGGLLETDESYAALVRASDADETARDMTVRMRDWHRLDEARQAIRQRWASFFQVFDVLLCPVAPVAAIPHDVDPGVAARTVHFSPRTIDVNGRARPYPELMRWMSLASLAYLPAGVAPIGRTRAGLPVGIQVVGPYLRDRTVIDVLRQLQGIVGGFQRPAGY